MPAQPGDDAGTLADQVFTMVDQQPQFTLHAIETRGRQIRFAQRGPRHGHLQHCELVAFNRIRLRRVAL
jgi:hypothetical protein